MTKKSKKEGRTVDESYSKINKTRSFINFVTAAAFLLLSAYHTYLFAQITESRPVRLLEIISFLCLAFAAVFTMISKPAFRILRSVLMTGGLALNFIIGLFNVGVIFGSLEFANIPSVLNFAAFVFSQLANLLLPVYYVFFRHNPKLNSKRILAIVLMSFVILLYIACLVTECVMLIKYSMNNESSSNFTVISRILYCIGFVGIAVNFMLPVQELENPDGLMNQPADSDLLFSNTESSTEKPHKSKNKQEYLPNGYGDDLKFSSTESSTEKPHKNKNKQEHLPSKYGDDLVFSATENRTKKQHKNKNRQEHLPSKYDDDLLFSTTENRTKKTHKTKNKQNHPHNKYDDDLVFSATESSTKKPHKNRDKQNHQPRKYDDDLLFSTTESSTKRPSKNKDKQKQLPSEYDDLLFSNTESSTKKPSRSKIKQEHLPNKYDDDFVL